MTSGIQIYIANIVWQYLLVSVTLLMHLRIDFRGIVCSYSGTLNSERVLNSSIYLCDLLQLTNCKFEESRSVETLFNIILKNCLKKGIERLRHKLRRFLWIGVNKVLCNHSVRKQKSFLSASSFPCEM